MQIIAFTLTYPPARFIGSELMTHRLLLELQASGHDVLVLVRECPKDAVWEFDGITVKHRTAQHPTPDVIVCHADLANRALGIARRYRVPLVGVCHNDGPGVRDNLERIPFALVVVNSESMRESLGVPDALVVNPPLRDHREPAREQGRQVLADRTTAA